MSSDKNPDDHGMIRIEKASEDRLGRLNVAEWRPWECEPSIFDWEYDTTEHAYVKKTIRKVYTFDNE